MTNGNGADEFNQKWWQINLKWWQINLSLWLLIGLLFLYFSLPEKSGLTKEIIVGGLILSLITFLGIAIPKVVMSSFTTALTVSRDTLFIKISEKIEGEIERFVIKAEEQRKAENEELKEAFAGGPTVQGLINKMKEKKHKDIELYRFIGLRGEEEDSGAFYDPSFQDFSIQGSNQNAVYFFWANTATMPPSEINAKVDKENKLLMVSFNTHSVGGANIAIRASHDIARIRENRMRYLCFEMRLRQDDESDSDSVEIGFRIVNGWLQHWEYSTLTREGYIKLVLKQSTFKLFHLDLENLDRWHLFPSDGNYLYGPDSADFSIISSIIFEVGCGEGNTGALAVRPGPGKGKFEVRGIRLSEHMEGDYIC